jgi:hypothetical protein
MMSLTGDVAEKGRGFKSHSGRPSGGRGRGNSIETWRWTCARGLAG